MHIEMKNEGGVVTITPEGKLNSITAVELGNTLRKALEEATELIFDCEKLTYISSAGLRVILEAQQIMSEKGRMKLLNINDDIMEILEMTGFTAFLVIE